MDSTELSKINDFVVLFESVACPVCRNRFEYQSGSKVFRFKCSRCGLRLSIRSERTHIIHDFLPSLVIMAFCIGMIFATFLILTIVLKGWNLKLI